MESLNQIGEVIHLAIKETDIAITTMAEAIEKERQCHNGEAKATAKISSADTVLASKYESPPCPQRMMARGGPDVGVHALACLVALNESGESHLAFPKPTVVRPFHPTVVGIRIRH